MAPSLDEQTDNRTLMSVARTSTASTASTAPYRRRPSSVSASSESSSPTSPHQSPKVQLIPHSRTASFDMALTASERDLLDRTSFDHQDLSSQDFDFDDIFTYDKPQRKLPKIVEVSTLTRQRDWSNFSFSHYPAAMTARAQVNRHRSGISEKYLKNQLANLGTKRL